MNLSTKINILNDMAAESLSITFFAEWELNSYGRDSLFSMNGLIGPVRARGLTECIDKALDLAVKSGE